MGPEAKVKQQVKALLRTMGIWYYMPVQNGMGVVGIPDFICCWAGRFLAIETKAPGKRSTVTANQQKNLDDIVQAQGDALVVDDVAQLVIFFSKEM
jgi:hypothetical protein